MARIRQGFVDTTSLHEPAEIYYARSSAGRWYYMYVCTICTIFAAMVTIGTYFIYTVVGTYLEAPITTLVTTVAVKSMLLPEVTVCYTGAIDAAKLLENGLSKQAVRAVQKQFLYGGRSVEKATWTEAIESLWAAKSEIIDFMENHNMIGYDEFIKYASFNCSQLIHEYNQFDPYRFDDQSDSLNSSCKFLQTVPHRLYGTCYILPKIEQSTPFVTGGWTILLKAPLEHDLVQDLRYTRGFALQVANMYDGLTADSYKLPLNRTVAISLQPTKYKRLQHRQWPRSNVTRCYKSTENQTYMNCHTHIMLMRCKCFPFHIAGAMVGTKYENFPTCWPDNEYDCGEWSGLMENELEACEETRLPLCNETEYGAVLSYADFGAEQTITELGLAGSTQGVIHVQIGYNAMRYTSIEEQDTSGLDSCVSNIGGMFGLWLGGSIFTIIHLLTTLCGGCRQKTQTPPTPDGDRVIRTTQSIGVNTINMNEQSQSDTCKKIDLDAGFVMSALLRSGDCELRFGFGDTRAH